MRIVGGLYRSRKLKVPPGNTTRPTTDRVREAIFSALGDTSQNAIVLDLFAGSGAQGLESLSRGAKEVHFVDKSSAAVSVIKNNVKALDLNSNCYVYGANGLVMLKKFQKQSILFDLVFLDPPYNSNLLQQSLDFLNKNQLISTHGVVVAEQPSSDSTISHENFETIFSRRYGDTQVTFLRQLK